MFTKKKMRSVAVGVVTIATVLVAAGAASAAPQDNGSAGPVYIYNTGSSSVPTGNAATFLWDATATASSASDSKLGVFTCNANSTGSSAFIALASKSTVTAGVNSHDAATKPDNWDASKSLGPRTSNKDLLAVNLAPSTFNLGAAAGVKAAGGSYYLGVACTSNDGLTVESAYYRTVSVTAGTGTYSTTDAIITSQFRFTTQPQSQTAAVGADVTFTAAFGGTEPYAGASYQWTRAEAGTPSTFVNVGSSITTTTASLVLRNAQIANDDGAVYKVVATDTNGGTITSNPAVLSVSATTGSVALNAPVANANDGTLSLAVGAGSVTFGAAALNVPGHVNFSTSTGTLPSITVNDARVHSRPGWTLAAEVEDFTFATVNTISKAQLGLVPSLVSATAVGTSAGSSQVAGAAVYPATIASGLPNQTVGNTVLSGALTFVAPQEKPAGTYTSTMTLTVTSK
jgi:hypothetical protein